MKRSRFLMESLIVCLWAIGLFSATADENQAAKDQREATNDAQDFVFLTEARPLFIRMHVRIDGKPLQAAWNDFMKRMLDYLDVDANGVLSKAEADRAPSVAQILAGGLGGIGRGFGRATEAPADPTVEALDTNKDGKVTLDELASYYQKNGLAPFQFRRASQATPARGLATLLGGSRPEPSDTAVGEAAFSLLDVNKDGKLTRDELVGATAAMLVRDEDEDEIITPRELVGDAALADRAASGAGMMAMMGRGRRPGGGTADKSLVPITTSGEAPADLVRAIRDRYSAQKTKGADAQLSRKDIGLDEATFAQLDANRDGMLDGSELAGFVKRAPDVELVVRLAADTAAGIEAAAPASSLGRSSLGNKVRIQGDLATLDLGRVRLDIRGSQAERQRDISGYLEQQLVSQLKQADRDGKGYVDQSEAKNNRQFARLFKAMDRDGDGKVSYREITAYLDQLHELQTWAMTGCVSLSLSDQNRGVFDLLDTNRDGRLSVRELHDAPKLLESVDRDGKGSFTRGDVPRIYQITLSRGPAGQGDLGGAANLVDQYLGAAPRSETPSPTAGPLWFRKMDRNRDGDVSRREFLGSDEDFRKLDADGDGLISSKEAKRASD